MNDKEKIEKFDEIERIMIRYLPGGTLYLPTGKELVLAKVVEEIIKVFGGGRWCWDSTQKKWIDED